MRACRHGHAQRAVLQATSGPLSCRLPAAGHQPVQPAQLLRRGQMALQRGGQEGHVRARASGSGARVQPVEDVVRLPVVCFKLRGISSAAETDGENSTTRKFYVNSSQFVCLHTVVG